MIGHQQLCAFGYDQVGGGNALVRNALQFGHQLAHVQRDAVADDVGDVRIEGTRGQNMQGKSAVVVDNGVAGVCAALEPDDHVRGFRHHIRDLAFPFVTPVCAYDCFYHDV